MPYCQNCGTLNPPDNKFCENCGKAMASGPVRLPTQPGVQQTAQPLMQAPAGPVQWPRRLPSAGAALILICFFLPWLLVSCNVSLGANSKVTATGYEIASGNYSALQNSYLGTVNYAASEVHPSPLLILIPLLGLAGFVSLNGRVSGSVIAIIAGILGILGMIIFSIAASAAGNQFQQLGYRLELGEGYWGTWIGFLWIAIIAVLTIKPRT